jgi:hypothetical protein
MGFANRRCSIQTSEINICSSRRRMRAFFGSLALMGAPPAISQNTFREIE